MESDPLPNGSKTKIQSKSLNVNSESSFPSSSCKKSSSTKNATGDPNKTIQSSPLTNESENTQSNSSTDSDMQFQILHESFSNILEQCYENPSRPGLIKTPKRAANAFLFLTKGYNMDINTVINDAIFVETSNSNMVIVKDIPIFSLCEHHLLPFYGKAHIGYYPDGKVLGLSKFPRICDMFSRRFQLQERLTQQIVTTIQDILKPLGAIVVIEASHMCVAMRGVEKVGSKTITSATSGCFEKDSKHRSEFMTLIKL